MNDRFNFRHWDKQINKMRYGDISLSSSGEPFILHCETEKLLSIEDIDDVITMQCTGRKDKNGTLIYEGDIVKVFSLEQSGYIEWNDKYLQWFIDLSRVYGKAEYSYYLTELYDFDSKNDLEVIGNIYENPELLKGVKDE